MKDIKTLKALCHDMRHNCVLMSSLFQKSNLRGYRKYEHAQDHGIVYGSSLRSNACNTKILLKLIIFGIVDNQKNTVKPQEQVHCLKRQIPDRVSLSGQI